MSFEAIATRLPAVGIKRVCVSCATRFYDLARTPPVCPKCGTEQPPEAPRAPPIRRSTARHRMVKAPSPVAREADDDAAPVLDSDEEDEEDVDEDAETVEDEGDEEPESEAVLDEPSGH